MNRFDDIRPYNDAEVRPTIERLLADKEFIFTVGRLRFPKIPEFLLFLLAPLIRHHLSRQTKGVNSVNDLQVITKPYLQRVIDDTTSGVCISGTENLKDGKPHLFISNHRDIAMDPTLVNWALYTNGHDTLRIAIGNNL
jgi:hypothetical protein